MISALELALMLRGAERDDQLDAIEHLITNGDSSFVVKDGQIIGLANTAQGNQRLRAIMLPAAQS